jgi:iron uptake system EfeUOB component EfeO/EfeM
MERMVRWRDWRVQGVAALVAAGAAFALTLTLGIGAPSAAPSASAAAAPPLADYEELSPHVLSHVQILSATRPGAGRQLGLEYPPFSPSRFVQPVAEYLAYADTQLRLMASPLASLQTALSDDDRAAAETAWDTAYWWYLHLGAVYLEPPVDTLNQAIDGSPGGIPGGTASPRFTGLHRIEYGLWTGEAPSSLVGYVRGLATDVQKMRVLLPRVGIGPLDYATRAHEILEDAQRDLLSGADVPWSQEGVLGTAAGLIATREVLTTLRSLINPSIANTDLDQLGSVLHSLAAAHGGTLPTNTQLTQDQSEELNGALGQALEGLAQVPGSLETAAPAGSPVIPRSAVEIDP